jgi:SnoaL-like domain
MNHYPGKKSVPPSVGADVSGIETLLNRNLPEVFGEGDPARRRAAIEELYAEDCVLCVPPGTFVGHDALDKFAGDLRATHPHYVYTPHGAPQVLHNSGRLAWGSGPKGEAPQYTGVDFIIARDGKIALCLPRLAAHIALPIKSIIPQIRAARSVGPTRSRQGRVLCKIAQMSFV